MRKTIVKALCLFVLLGCPGPLRAACAAVDSDRIHASDLAAIDPVFAGIDGAAEAGYAPVPGAVRLLSGRELAALAARHGKTYTPGSGVCVIRRVYPIEEAQLREAVEQAAATLGAAVTRVEIAAYSRISAPRGRFEFPKAGLIRPPAGAASAPWLWRGRLIFDESRSLPVWVKVQIRTRVVRVVAAGAIAAGSRVEAAGVRIEEVELPPPAAKWASSVESVAGKAVRRAVAAGEPLAEANLVLPPLISRGQTVAVEAAAGPGTFQFHAVSETSGREGEAIVVRDPENGRRLRARVTAPGRATAEDGPAIAGNRAPRTPPGKPAGGIPAGSGADGKPEIAPGVPGKPEPGQP